MKVHNKKKIKGKPKFVNKNKPRVVSAPRTPKKPYSAEGTLCKSCNKGTLRYTQWNRFVCNICNYSELI